MRPLKTWEMWQSFRPCSIPWYCWSYLGEIKIDENSSFQAKDISSGHSLSSQNQTVFILRVYLHSSLSLAVTVSTVCWMSSFSSTSASYRFLSKYGGLSFLSAIPIRMNFETANKQIISHTIIFSKIGRRGPFISNNIRNIKVVKETCLTKKVPLVRLLNLRSRGSLPKNICLIQY